MISCFKVKNYKSIQEEAILDFTADDTITDMLDNWSTKIGYGDHETHLLKTLLLYGHNASGKSNLLNAFKLFAGALISANNILEILYQPYFFADKEEAIEFTIEFYAPDFDQSSEKFIDSLEKEELESYKKYSYQAKIAKNSDGHPIVISEIYKDIQGNIVLFEIIDGDRKEIAPYLKKSSKGVDIQQQIDVDSTLFYLYTHFRNKDYENAPIRNLQTCLRKIFKSMEVTSYSASSNKVSVFENLFPVYTKLFQSLDIDIQKLALEKTEKDSPEVTLMSYHPGNKKWEFDKNESHGTLELLKHIATIVVSLNNSVCMIDELAGLHTLAIKDILKIFQNYDDIKIGKTSQLILATHDSNLLQNDFLRADQIYFAEKQDQQSHFYSLSDIENYKNISNIEQAYLTGKFGGIKNNLESLGFPKNILMMLESHIGESNG